MGVAALTSMQVSQVHLHVSFLILSKLVYWVLIVIPLSLLVQVGRNITTNEMANSMRYS